MGRFALSFWGGRGCSGYTRFTAVRQGFHGWCVGCRAPSQDIVSAEREAIEVSTYVGLVILDFEKARAHCALAERRGRRIMEATRTLVYICNYAANYKGNFIRSICSLARRWKGRQLLVLPSTAREKGWASKIHEVDVVFCDFDRKTLNALAGRLLDVFGPDAIIYMHFMGSNDPLPFCRLFRTVVVHYHMTVVLPKTLVGKLKRVLKRALFRLAYRDLYLIGVSSPVCDSLARLYSSSQIICIPNAIDFSRYAGLEDSLEPSHIKGAVNALLFGSDFYRKGADTAIEAIDILRLLGRDVRLTIATHDVASCGKLVEKLRGKVPDWVTIVPVREDVASLYAAADIFLSPSRSEAFGYAVLEAAYCGCVVVASDVPGQNSLRGVPGLTWVPAENPDALADGIDDALDRLRTKTKPEKTQRYLEEHYGIDRWVKEEMAFLRGI